MRSQYADVNVKSVISLFTLQSIGVSEFDSLLLKFRHRAEILSIATEDLLYAVY
jgi:hypothetical protein